MQGAAILSEDGLYRYSLTRVWNPSLPILPWTLLNPSKADAHIDDPTVKRCVAYSLGFGFGGMELTNLFGFRATVPGELGWTNDPIGSENQAHLVRISKSPQIVVAWGALDACGFYGARERADYVLDLYRMAGAKLWCIGKTAYGFPRHPCRAPHVTRPALY